MVLLMLFGLWVIITGKVIITKNISFAGKKARIYGLLLIALSVPWSVVVSYLLQLVLPASLLVNSYVEIIINAILIILFVVLLAIPFREQ